MELLFWIIAIAAVPFAIAGAFYMDRRLRETKPDVLPYKWGYYNGWMGILTSIICAAIFFGSAATAHGKQSEYYAIGLLFLVLAMVGAGFVFRNKWWATASIMAQFNPILWIINGIYIKNRWHEMSNGPNFSTVKILRAQSKAIRTIIVALIFWVTVASAYVFLFEPYGWEIDWEHLFKVLVFPPIVITIGYFLYQKLLAGDEQ